MIFRKKKKETALPPALMKILVLRFSSIGDIVLTTPVLRCLKQQLPSCTIDYLTKASFKPILSENPYINQLLTFEKNVDEVIPQLRAKGYTHIIDLHNNLRSTQVKQALSEVPSQTVNKLNTPKWLLVNFKINLLPPISIVERYLRTIKSLGVHNDGKGLDYFIPDRNRITNEDIPFSHWAGFIACVIGGTYTTKRFPTEKWRSFCEKSPYPIILLGGPEDRDMGRDIAAIDDIKVYNSCGKFNINESADIVARAKVVITNDTGLMHIAAAFQKPIISIWGNTSPLLGMFPYYGYNNLNNRIAPQSSMHEVQGLGCHPCSKIGYERCPRGHFKCMYKQDVPKMIADVQRLWQQSTSAS